MTAFPAKIVAAELDLQQTLINLGIPVAADPVRSILLRLTITKHRTAQR
jgi:hypothetical protein